MPIRILLVEDNPGDARLIREMLKTSRRTRFDVSHSTRLEDALKRAGEQAFDLVLLDLGLPDSQGLGTFDAAQRGMPLLPIVVLTGSSDDVVGTEAVRRGAQDFLVKGQANADLLDRSIRYAIERRSTRTQLRGLYARQEAILAAVPDIITEVDVNKTYTWTNRAGFEFFGQDVLGREASSYFVDEQDTYSRVDPLFRGDESTVYVESWQRRCDDEKRLLAWWCRVLKDMEGTVRGALSTGRDITDYRRAEEDVKRRKEYLETIMDSSRDLIATIRDDGTLGFASKGIKEILGYDFEDVRGRHFLEFVTPDLHAFMEKKWREVQTGCGGTFETKVSHAKGSQVDCLVSWCPLKDSDESVAIFRDITESKRAERELQEALETKSRFILMVSHELRTPLTSIKEGIGLVLDGVVGEVIPEQRASLEIAKRNVDRLARLINDVLNFQKLSNGKMNFDMELNDINSVVSDVCESMRPVAQKKGLALELKISDALEPFPFDRDKITQVLLNLIHNSVKFTDSGYIRVATGGTRDEVEVTVSDTGRGIEEMDIPRLFNKFEQLVGGIAGSAGGTGLGLAISKEIIQGHGGRVWAESEPGRGTAFHFCLPRKPVSARDSGAGEDRHETANAACPGMVTRMNIGRIP